MREVIEAVDGAICLNVCLIPGRSCSRKAHCPAHPVWIEAQQAMMEVLSAPPSLRWPPGGSRRTGFSKTRHPITACPAHAPFAFLRPQCFNRIIETGVLRGIAGLRNTLEPDPDNTGVGSFRAERQFFHPSQLKLLCFRQIEAKEAMSSAVLIARDRQTLLRIVSTSFARGLPVVPLPCRALD